MKMFQGYFFIYYQSSVLIFIFIIKEECIEGVGDIKE